VRLAFGAALFVAFGAVQDPAQELKTVLKDTNVHASWIYNDFAKGLAEAKKSGKPLVVVFR
jgi:hypothetical protein